jgi:hypothetical protein
VEEMERLTRLQGRLSLIVYLEDSLNALHSSTQSVPLTGPLADLVTAFVEGLDFVLLTLIDALENKDPEAVEMLVGITSDRGEFVERIRYDYLGDKVVKIPERAVLLQVTTLFERIVWITHRLAALLGGSLSTAKPVSLSATR